MANKLSAQKRVRIAERQTAVNRNRKDSLRFQHRTMRRLLADQDAKAAVDADPKTFAVNTRAAI